MIYLKQIVMLHGNINVYYVMKTKMMLMITIVFVLQMIAFLNKLFVKGVVKDGKGSFKM